MYREILLNTSLRISIVNITKLLQLITGFMTKTFLILKEVDDMEIQKNFLNLYMVTSLFLEIHIIYFVTVKSSVNKLFISDDGVSFLSK